MLVKNVKICTMIGLVIEDGYIYIEGKTISKIGEMKHIEEDLKGLNYGEIIDGEDMTAYPGFIDAHCHIGLWEDSVGIEGEDGNEENNPVAPHLRAIDAINPFDRCFKDALEYGVTSVVVAPGSANPIGGQVVAMKTVGHRVDNMLIKEPLAIKFALGENPKKVYGDKDEQPSTRMTIAAEIREQLQKAKRYMNEIDYAESDEEYDEPDYDVKCEALLPLLKKQIQAHFHAHRADDIFTAIRIAKEFNLDYVIVHGTESALICDDLKEENTNLIIGPMLCDRCKVEMKNLDTKTPGLLSEERLEIAICTDHPVIPIEYLSFCAALAVKDGMSKIDALKAITINPAKICGLDDRIGSLEVGKDADIILFDEDPLNIKVKPKVVIVNGERKI